MSSDEENEDGDFTVYECPGLAPVSPAAGAQGRAVGVGWGLPRAPSSPACLTPAFTDRRDGGPEPAVRPLLAVRAPAAVT